MLIITRVLTVVRQDEIRGNTREDENKENLRLNLHEHIRMHLISENK